MGFFSIKIPLAFILISVVASWGDLGHIPSFIAARAAAKELRRDLIEAAKFCLYFA